MDRRGRVARAALAALSPFTCVQPARAQAAPQPPVVVEHVTVSASVAEEGRDAATFTSLSKEEIAERDRGQDLAMLLADTPGAYAYSDAGNGVGYAYLSLRGFDQRRVAVNINGVPLNGPESHQVYFIDLADFASSVQAIQVQRGTGTALYGSPAVGGVVNLETGALPSTAQGEVTFGAGSFGTYRGALRYATPLGHNWSLEARGTHVRSDGYREPAWTRHTLGQLTLQRVGPDSVLRVLAFAGPERTQLAYYAVPAEYLRGEVTGNTDHDRRFNPLVSGESDHFTQPQVQVIHDWRVGGVLLKNTAYAILGDGYFLQHSSTYDYRPLGIDPPTEKFPVLTLTDVWRQRALTNRQFGWIPTVRYDRGRGRLTAGLEILQHSGRHDGHIDSGNLCLAVGPDGECAESGAALTSKPTLYDFTNHKLTTSAFVRESWRVTPSFALDLELQATHHRYSMDDDQVRGFSYDTQYSFLTPRLGFTWKPAADWGVYGTLSTAESEPTFSNVWDPEDTFANPRPLFASFDIATRHLEGANARPERLRAAEIGAGWRHAGASFKANAYWMDFRDELVFAGGLDDDGQPITDNAARSLHRGLELEGAVRLPGQVQLTGYLAVSDDQLKDYTLQFGPNPEDQVDYSGNRIALFPESQARLRVSRRFGAVDLLFGLRRIGQIYLDNSEDERLNPAAREVPGYVNKLIEPFTLGELQAKVDLSSVVKGRGRALTLLLHADNLFDKRYTASGYVYDVPYFYVGATRTLYAGVTYGF